VIDSVGRFVYRVRRQNECMLALMSVLALIRHALLTIHQEGKIQHQKRSLSSSLRQTLLEKKKDDDWGD
jgi:cell division protein FtsL